MPGVLATRARPARMPREGRRGGLRCQRRNDRPETRNRTEEDDDDRPSRERRADDLPRRQQAGLAGPGQGVLRRRELRDPVRRAAFSGVVYKTVGRHLYLAVAPDSWKARHIADGAEVSVTVLVRRGGLLSLLFPIPPATISFHARAIVHPTGSFEIGSLSKELASLVPAERRAACVLLELVPEGSFLTYGVGVSLMEMTRPAAARARVPVA